VVKEFAGDDHIVFGDVNLRDGSMPEKYQAGHGGWPTVRYFNAETGYDGAPYTQKTSGAMCDELGKDEYMRAYVQDKGVKPCEPLSAEMTNCSPKEKKFIDTWKPKTIEQRQTEHARLSKMGERLVATADIMKWHRQRVAILAQLVKEGHQDL